MDLFEFATSTGFQIEFHVNRSLVLKLTELTSHFVLNLKKFQVNKFVLIVYVMSISKYCTLQCWSHL